MSRLPKKPENANPAVSIADAVLQPFHVKPAKRRLNSELREVIQNAFYKAGGRDYLVRVAKSRPDVFLALLAKVLPSEQHISVLHGYQALPVPVEVRDPITALLPAPAATESPEILTREIPDAVLVAPGNDDDWLG